MLQKKLLKCLAVVRSWKHFLLKAAAGPSSCENRLRGTVYMWYWYGQIAVKQIVKLLIVAIILKNFNKRSLHCLLEKRDTLCIMQHWSAFVQPLLQWKSRNYYTFWISVNSLSCRARKRHAPYYIVVCVLAGSTIFYYNITYAPWLSEKFLKIQLCFYFIYNLCL
jgi:hypothetical protein